MLNAAIWLGASVFFTFVAGPAFFSDAMLQVLQHRYYAGAAAEVVIGRSFLLHYGCAGVALVHLLWERLYSGRRLSRDTLGLWLLLAGLILFGGVQCQSRLRAVHHTMYWGETAALQAGAERSFHTWHRVARTANYFVLGGLVLYFTRLLRPGEPQHLAISRGTIQGLTN